MRGRLLQEERRGGFTGNDARTWLLARIPAAERRLNLAGVSTAVLEGGEGTPVVLLHGPGESAVKWFQVIAGLVRTHRVIAPDLPGHGASEDTEGRLDGDRVLAWLGELIERTCQAPPALVGQVVAGAIAARFAAARGDQLSHLVLVDALGLAPFRPAPEFERVLMAFLAQPGEATYEGLWSRCAFDVGRLRERLGDAWEPLKAYHLDRARVPVVQEALHALMGEFGMPAIPEAELARITAPTTLIWGRHDLATSLHVAEAASTRHGWPLHVIEDAGDDPAIEAPEAFLDVLRSTLAVSEPREANTGSRTSASRPR